MDYIENETPMCRICEKQLVDTKNPQCVEQQICDDCRVVVYYEYADKCPYCHR